MCAKIVQLCTAPTPFKTGYLQHHMQNTFIEIQDIEQINVPANMTKYQSVQNTLKGVL